ncbi:MAG TPA: hypothetical protein VGL41_07715 [Roseiarcus sp.]|jgi:membrane protein implicated in regulation of membrane protease activity
MGVRLRLAIWIGVAGLILGAVEFSAPTTLTVQLLGFTALVAGLLFIGRRVYGRSTRWDRRCRRVVRMR